MANYLIFKGKEAKSTNTVETALSNYEITQEYTNFKEINAAILASGNLDLGEPETLQSTIPFIVVISNNPVNLSFKDDTTATISCLKSIYYLAGNIKGYNFALANTGTETANIIFRIYW
jgi:hypothetical protein